MLHLFLEGMFLMLFPSAPQILSHHEQLPETLIFLMHVPYMSYICH